jgi:hypothetical protein
MTLWNYLVAWANVPFTVAVGVTLLFALVQASGLAGLLGGHDADAGDADGDADADADADGDADDAHDADDADGESALARLGSAFGMGRLPMTLLAQVFLIVLGVCGLLINVPFIGAGAIPLTTLFYSLPLATIVALGGNAAMTRLLAPIVDDKAQAATRRGALVGSIATVISTKVTEEFGEVRIRDKSGHDLRLIVKLAKGDAASRLREGQEAVVVDVDDRGTPIVSALDVLAARVDIDEPPTDTKRVATKVARAS